jgi:hypothetical protein
MKKKLLTYFFSIHFLFGFSQMTSSATFKNFEFLVEQLRNNYVGYSLKNPKIVQKKINKLKSKINSNISDKDFFNEFSKILIYYKDLHIRFRINEKTDSLKNNIELKSHLKSIEKSNIKATYLDGIWKSNLNDLIIQIRQVSKGKYIGYVLESKTEKQRTGDYIFDLNYISKHTYSTNLITQQKKSFLPTILRNGELLMGVFCKWTKLNYYIKGTLDTLEQFKPIIEFTNIKPNWNLIKIPKSDLAAKKSVDSLLLVNKTLIECNKNLLIDIRNNSGGTWLVYKSLFKYIFDDLVFGTLDIHKSSDSLISTQQEFVKYDSINKNEYFDEDKILLDSLIANKNGLFFDKADTIFKPSLVYNFPKNIYLLFNFRCVSASEMFIKFCQQSTKVKTFGERTFGAANYVEPIFYKTIDGKFEIGLPRLKCVYKDEKSDIDFRGITPDFIISEDSKNWITYIIENNE